MAGPTEGPQVVERPGRTAEVQRLDVINFEAATAAALGAPPAGGVENMAAEAGPAGALQGPVVAAHPTLPSSSRRSVRAPVCHSR